MGNTRLDRHRRSGSHRPAHNRTNRLLQLYLRLEILLHRRRPRRPLRHRRNCLTRIRRQGLEIQPQKQRDKHRRHLRLSPALLCRRHHLRPRRRIFSKVQHYGHSRRLRRFIPPRPHQRLRIWPNRRPQPLGQGMLLHYPQPSDVLD